MYVPETASTNLPSMKSLVNLTSTLGTSNDPLLLPFAVAMLPRATRRALARESWERRC